MITTISDATFEQEVGAASRPSLVHFTAPWCSPCRDLARQLVGLSEEMGDHLRVFRLDINDNPKVAAKFGVRALPTCLLLREGQVVAMKLGGASSGDLLDWIRRAL